MSKLLLKGIIHPQEAPQLLMKYGGLILWTIITITPHLTMEQSGNGIFKLKDALDCITFLHQNRWMTLANLEVFQHHPMDNLSPLVLKTDL